MVFINPTIPSSLHPIYLNLQPGKDPPYYANPKRTQPIHRPALQRLEPRQNLQTSQHPQDHPLPLGAGQRSNHSPAQIRAARENPGAVRPVLRRATQGHARTSPKNSGCPPAAGLQQNVAGISPANEFSTPDAPRQNPPAGPLALASIRRPPRS